MKFGYVSDYSLFEYSIAILSILICSVLIYCYKLYTRKGTILIIGTENSGKTSIFCYLVYGQHFETINSFKMNIGIVLIGKKEWEIVDIPSNAKLFSQSLIPYLSKYCVIMYTINSSHFVTESQDIAKHFYNTISMFSKTCKIVVVCTHSDEMNAKSIRQELLSLLQRDYPQSAYWTKQGYVHVKFIFSSQHQPLSAENVTHLM
ncbi:hypothetical protein A3Q56_04472 [Intoshia linei]|uniref:Signal recognition particle receptor subunit beta n=1 Tax=Intoshia linei TaxID=1819745 RepID=A0A177B0B3_9BILA|nr:hypothetical protein A3Q56_04472 [Intoshia linei]